MTTPTALAPMDDAQVVALMAAGLRVADWIAEAVHALRLDVAGAIAPDRPVPDDYELLGDAALVANARALLAASREGR